MTDFTHHPPRLLSDADAAADLAGLPRPNDLPSVGTEDAAQAMTPAQVAHIMALVEAYADSTHISSHENCLAARAAVEAALRDAPQAEGWVMVPVEPTPAMLVAMWGHREAMRGQSENRIARAGYAAMLAAAPSAPTAVEPDEREDWGPGPHEHHWSKSVTDEQWEKAVRSLPLEWVADDPLLAEALSLCVEKGYTSISFVQRRLNIGYQRAGELVATINKRGLFDAAHASKGTK